MGVHHVQTHAHQLAYRFVVRHLLHHPHHQHHSQETQDPQDVQDLPVDQDQLDHQGHLDHQDLQDPLDLVDHQEHQLHHHHHAHQFAQHNVSQLVHNIAVQQKRRSKLQLDLKQSFHHYYNKYPVTDDIASISFFTI